MNELIDIWHKFSQFISTNETPNNNKIIVASLTVAILATIIFIISNFVKSLRNKNILKLDNYNLKSYFYWVGGAVCLNFLVMITGIIKYNLISFVAVAMIWDVIFQRIFNKTNESDIGNIDTLDASSNDSIED